MGKSKTAKLRKRAGEAARLKALYAELPKVECRGLCQEACGPVGMTRAEWRRVTERAGEEPSCGEDLTCSMLGADGRCRVYDVRPAVCRMFGVVETMPCPFGCEPERVVGEAEGFEFLDRVARAGGESLVTLRLGAEVLAALEALRD